MTSACQHCSSASHRLLSEPVPLQTRRWSPMPARPSHLLSSSPARTVDRDSCMEAGTAGRHHNPCSQHSRDSQHSQDSLHSQDSPLLLMHSTLIHSLIPCPPTMQLQQQVLNSEPVEPVPHLRCTAHNDVLCMAYVYHYFYLFSDLI